MSHSSNGAPLDLSLILGGVRAGKSAKALQLAQTAPASRGVLFVATAQALDDEMLRRIDTHRSQRPPSWETLESPVAIADDIEQRFASSGDAIGVVVIDCITLWVSNILLTLADDADAEAILARRTAELIDVCRRHRMVADAGVSIPRRWIVVTNEVGLGIVPPTPLGRRYRDALGRANQLLAAAARDVTLMVAGVELVLKSS